MRHPIELREKIDHLTWYKQEVIYYFRIMPMSAQKHAVLAAFYRTIDNEIALLRWALGEIEQTWSDDHSGADDIAHRVELLPPTEFPHLPYKRHAGEYWSTRPVQVCPYLAGPDSPSDDPDFNPANAQDPTTWKRQVYPRRGGWYFENNFQLTDNQR